MAALQTSALLRQIRRLSRPALALTDRQLLKRFIAEADDAAFAELLARYGSLVLDVCRRTLQREQDAEDAFQAAFLVLARNAASIRKTTSLASWLYGVAWRCAMRLRADLAERRRHERVLAQSGDCSGARSSVEEPPDLSWREVQQALYEELARLPEKYRAPLVLCYLQGKTQCEAAQQLGCSQGVLHGRLDRGREQLRRRLQRRGITLSAALLAAAVLRNAPVSAALILATQKAAILVAAGQTVSAAATPAIAALVDGAARVVGVKAKLAVLVLLAGIIGGTLGLASSERPAATGQQAKGETKPDAALPEAEGRKPKVDLYGDLLPAGAVARIGTVRFRHGGQIEKIALAPDGRTLAAASRDQTVRLWNMTTGQEIRRLPNHEGSVRFVAYSPDGTRLATGVSPSGVVHLWDAATGEKVRQLKHAGHWVGHVAFSPDGKIVAAGASRHVILLWDAATGQLLRQLDGGEKASFAVPIAFSPDGQYLASGGEGETVRLWNVASGKEERRFEVKSPLPKEEAGPPFNPGIGEAVAFSPNGRTLASAALRSPVRIWEVATGKEIRSLQGDQFGAFSVAFASDGKTLVTGEGAGTVRIWETASGKEVRRLQAHHGWVSGLEFADDGRTLVTTGGSIIKRWELATGKELVPDRGHSAGLSSCVMLPDRQTLVTAGSDSTIRWWSLKTGKELSRFAADTDAFDGTILSPNGAKAACFKRETVGKNESHLGVQLWDLTTRKKGALLWKPNIFGSVFSPDGKTLITQAWDVKESAGILREWDVATGRELRVLARMPDAFQDSALSSNHKLLAGVCPGPEARVDVWDVASAKRLRQFPLDQDFNHALAFSPNSKLLAVGDGARSQGIDSRVLYHHVHLWDLATGKKILQFGRATTGYWPLAFSADGRMLATSGEDNRIRLWEAATGVERLCLDGHEGRVQGFLFTDDGSTLISRSDDTTALVWDVTGRASAKLKPLTEADLSACWADLTTGDGARSFQSLRRLIASPTTSVVFLGTRLEPLRAPTANRMSALIADLDSENFATREAATKELIKLNDLAAPALREALDKSPSPEARRRLDQLLVKAEDPGTYGEPLRSLRAVEALEHIATPEARQVLQNIVTGAPEARLTRDAKAALQRLERLNPKRPEK
jgi:RNA polymerase sigma factor (sigma-70 family)